MLKLRESPSLAVFRKETGFDRANSLWSLPLFEERRDGLTLLSGKFCRPGRSPGLQINGWRKAMVNHVLTWNLAAKTAQAVTLN